MIWGIKGDILKQDQDTEKLVVEEFQLRRVSLYIILILVCDQIPK